MAGFPTLRIKHALTTYRLELAMTVLVLIGVCVSLLLTTAVTPALAISPLAEDPQPDPRTHIAGVSQEATVTTTGSTAAFREGQTLEDRSVFPLQNASTPVLTVSGDGQDATVTTIEVQTVYTASSGTDSGRFYTTRETIATKQIDGTSGRLETPVNVSAVFDTQARLEDEFGSGVTITPTIRSIVTYQYTAVAGQTRTRTVTVNGEVTAVGNLVSLPGGANQRRETTGPPTTDPISPLVNTAIGAFGVGFIILFGAVVFVSGQSDRRELDRQIQANRYDEWVTEIHSYTPREELIVVQVDTLVGLVNLAIDINDRVLYTPELGRYIVVDGDTLYKYQPGGGDVDRGSASPDLKSDPDPDPDPKRDPESESVPKPEPADETPDGSGVEMNGSSATVTSSDESNLDVSDPGPGSEGDTESDD